MTSPAQPNSSTRLLTFASGGWVLALAAALTLGLVIWAVLPALLMRSDRPRGDGRDITTYGFDLSNLQVPRDLVAAAALRDEIPVITAPGFSDPEQSQRLNDPKYGKYLVSNDRVIGVAINGEVRAYPLHVMYVHEIVNDVLGGVPIAVTYNWLTDSVVVFDRRLGERTVEFRFSGLVYNSNLLMYDHVSDETAGKTLANGAHQSGDDASATSVESLWSQLLARAVSGPMAGTTLQIIPSDVSRWVDWLQQHPQTTVLNRNLRMAARYKNAAPTQYMQSAHLLFPVQPLPDPTLLPWKTPVIAIAGEELRRVYPMPRLVERARRVLQSNPDAVMPSWTESIDALTLRFTMDPTLQTVRVEHEPVEKPLRITHAYWFAWHAMYPDDALVIDSGEAHSDAAE